MAHTEQMRAKSTARAIAVDAHVPSGEDLPGSLSQAPPGDDAGSVGLKVRP